MAPAGKAESVGALFLLTAQDAGLDTAIRDYPEDLLSAAQSAAQLRNALYALDDVAAEPWPPMHVRVTP